MRNGIDGFLVQSAEQACEAVKRIGTIDRAQCRARATTTFSAEVVTRQYEWLYEGLL